MEDSLIMVIKLYVAFTSLNILINQSLQLHETDTIMTPILCMRNMRQRH